MYKHQLGKQARYKIFDSLHAGRKVKIDRYMFARVTKVKYTIRTDRQKDRQTDRQTDRWPMVSDPGG